MRTLNKINLALIAFTALVLASCSSRKEEPAQKCDQFEIRAFAPLGNWQQDSASRKTIDLDYDHATTGFVIPSGKQIKGGLFSFDFEIKNNSTEQLYYKIYYRNESYKFEEADSASGNENQFSEENFYGSWENTDQQFKPIDVAADESFHHISDNFRILGNPRNETRYIQNGINNRWQRNPRVGTYSFLLVVVTKSELANIPDYVQNIGLKKDGRFQDPYYYFLHGEGRSLKAAIVTRSETSLKVTAQPDLGKGIYVDGALFGSNVDKSSFCSTCGQDSSIYHNAAFGQFVNFVDPSTRMDNIPVIADILKDNYSKLDYNWNKSFYRKEELIPTLIQTARKPCATVSSDPEKHKIQIRNPKTTFGEWKKESVGIITRHGLTYGKYRVKVKLTELLNKNNVWNGLTNAIWLITQGGGEWNFRRKATKDGGYMATYWGGPDDKRVPQVDYTEIDFEILKTPPYCPANIFPPVYKNPSDNPNDINSWNIPLPEEITNNDGSITVACTNWDMACRDPKNFGVGCNPVQYKDQTFEAHRWDNNYRALTEKKPESDDELFGGDYYYFEIEWKPKEIIWRIGPEPDKLRVVGYMNDLVTAIPNNQMLLIITQEYHNTKWWPGAPYSQDNLPFPLNDIPGEIYELVIE